MRARGPGPPGRRRLPAGPPFVRAWRPRVRAGTAAGRGAGRPGRRPDVMRRAAGPRRAAAPAAAAGPKGMRPAAGDEGRQQLLWWVAWVVDAGLTLWGEGLFRGLPRL
jgi:hypothetical protein